MPLILSINASPHPDGHIGTALQAMEQSCVEAGCTIRRIDTATLQVAPCRGCMACRKNGDCALSPDDAHSIAEMLAAADGVIIAAPTYWANMPGPLKTLFDRMVYALIDTSGPSLLPRKLHRGKPAVIITACTTPWPWNVIARQSSGCTRGIRSILTSAGFDTQSTITITGTAKAGATSAKVIGKAHKIGSKLAAKAHLFASLRNKQ